MFEELLSRGGLSLDRLRAFCAVAAAGGIARATGRDPVKQSLFSRQIRELEAFFGVELTTRRGKHIALTAAGERLARVAREQFKALSNFHRECRDEPVTLSIGSGNSIIEWLLLPGLGGVQSKLPNVSINLIDQRTADNLRGLADMTIDLAIIRRDAVPQHLKSTSLGTLGYALFAPRRLVKRNTDLKTILGSVPMATSKGGTFRQLLDAATARAKLPLKIALSCASFTQAARAARSGDYGAILPLIAAVDLPEKEFVSIPLPFLKSHGRQLALAWNERLADVRPVISKVAELFSRTLKEALQLDS